jgi:integrase
LVQYLCNGFNLVDAGQLQYPQYYFDTERRAFLFKRKKTMGRAKEGTEVIIPIIEPLQKILDEIAAEPKLNAYVFPDILKGADNEKEIRRQVSLENSNVQDRVIRVCQDILHWEVRPSSTWCRHSFATNLSHAGVDRGYVTESMGHSQSQSVTDRYIANYPLDVQMKNNSLLLNLNKEEGITKESLSSMSKEELMEMIMKLTDKQ